ncbi:phosphoribosylaminoimidazolesuccinocarboxamide synthase [Calditrichota bacterium]
MNKGQMLHEGKAKKLFLTDEDALVIQEFKDDATAFNGAKKSSIGGKGAVNCQVSAILFEYLESFHIKTHFEKTLSDNEMLIRKLEMVPLEAVMRNIATGSLVKRLGFEDGKVLDFPIFELYLKNDDLGDPLVNEYHAHALSIAKPEEIRAMYRMTAKINAILKSFFDRRGLILVDFKIEFGKENGELILGDEISPDTCRIWDKKTGKKLDKDRFRFDMGGVDKAYQEVLERVSNR